MNKLARIASIFAALAALTAPAVALAKEPHAGVAHHEKVKARFPMDAAKFKQGIDARMAKLRVRAESRLERQGVPDAKRDEVHKALDEVESKVHAAIDLAAKDGVISQEEAKQVRSLTGEVRKAVAQRLGADKKKKAEKTDKVEKKGKAKPAATTHEG